MIIYGISTLIFSTLLGWSSRTVWGLAIIETIILSLLLLSITQLVRTKSKPRGLLIVTSGALIVSTIFSVYYYTSILKAAMYFLFIATFWLITRYLKTHNQTRLLIYFISYTALISAIYGIINFFQLADYSLGVSSFFGWRNIFAGFILLTLPVALVQFLTAKTNYDKSLFATTSVLLSVNLYFTFSQAAWIAFAFVLFILIWLGRHLPWKTLAGRYLVLVTLASLIIIGFIQAHSAPVGESIQQASSIQENAVDNRIDYWKTSWEIFTHYPIVGVGLGNFETIYTHYQQNIWSFSVSPHNILLLFLTEMGILGLIAFTYFLVYLTRKIKTVLNYSSYKDPNGYYYAVGIVGGIIASFCHSMVDVDLDIPSLMLLWLIEAGIITALANNLKRNNQNEQRLIYKKSKLQIPLLLTTIVLFGYIIFIPTITDLWNKQADAVQNDMGDMNISISQLEKAITLNPLDADLYSNISESYRFMVLDKNGDHESNQNNALIYAEKAVKLDPLSAKKHEALGYTLNFVSDAKDNNILKSENELQTAIDYNRNTPYTYQLLALVFYRQNKLTEALGILDSAIEIFDDKSINKIHADQEVHERLVEQMKSINNLHQLITEQQTE
jgi:tetratricopeptide (TPR) repeat protein